MINYGIVAHGGAGSPDAYSNGCKAACEAGFRLLESGQTSLATVVEAVRLLENDERFNAGYGSVLRIDGKTIEMDAAVMDSTGNIGIVINVRHVKNPILLAQAVLSTPHVALCGRGAEKYAKEIGFKPFYRIAAQSVKKFNKMKKAVEVGEFDVFWTKDADTVGAVALDRNGVFALATSTGGAAPMMIGRVGDTPMIGCGFFCGEHGAVAVTGLGEEIIRRMPAKVVHDLLTTGQTESACQRGVELFTSRTGIIAISRDGHSVVSNTGMASWAIVSG
ncbi:MAG: isoaspartyl peptidase/L-asparaginase [Nitrospirota bacterium]